MMKQQTLYCRKCHGMTRMLIKANGEYYCSWCKTWNYYVPMIFGRNNE